MTSTPTGQAPDPAMTLRARCADDLIAAAPLVLGFQPADSVVMLTSDGARPFHGRTNLPDRADPPETATAVAEQLVGAALRNGVRSLALLFYSDDERVVRPVWRAVRRAAHRAGLRVVEAVRVERRHYYPLLGDRRLRETAVAYDVAAHPFAAQGVLRGIVVEKDRAALVASVAPDPAAQRQVQDSLDAHQLTGLAPPRTGADRRRWGEWLQRIVRQHVRSGTRLTDEEVARAAWAIQDPRVRDAAWALIERQDAQRHQELWQDVTRRTPDAFAPAPAALLGWAAWQAGNGALAWIAVDRCHEVAPGYSMAAILARCLEEAVPPDTFDADFAWDEGLPA